jgi:tryptophan-rich sensory protein
MPKWAQVAARGAYLTAAIAGTVGTGFALGTAYPVTGTAEWARIRPRSTPPSWVFAVVWTLLFSLLATVVWSALVLRDCTKFWPVAAGGGLLLALLFAWMPAAAQSWEAALVVLVLAAMVAAVLTTGLAAGGLWEATLVAPLLVWLAYAGGLNQKIVEST